MLNILGYSGNGLSIADAYGGGVRYFDDTIDNFPNIEEAPSFIGDGHFINGISSEDSYLLIPEIIKRSGIKHFATVIHPSAVISAKARIGTGVFIGANTVVCADAQIGDHCIILQNTTINHHSIVCDYSTVSSNVCILGYVTIGYNAFIGGGASIKPRVRIGESALVGMGSVVTKDVDPDKIVCGNPARVM